MPAAADRWVWAAAPVVVFAPAVLLFVILPVGPDFGVQPDFNLGLLFLSAVSSFTLFGIFMAGWGSNNKYSLIGAMRAAAQLMAYEIPLVLAVLGVVMLAAASASRTSSRPSAPTGSCSRSSSASSSS